MSDLSFEQKVENLQGFYKSMRVMSPRADDPSPELDAIIFSPSVEHVVARGIADILAGVKDEIGFLGRREYTDQKYGLRDLRADTPDELMKRADILAVVTSPLTQEVREERAQSISEILESIVGGEPVASVGYDSFMGVRTVSDDEIVDVTRPLHLLFPNGHVTSRVLAVQYDTAETHGRGTYERPLKIDLNALFMSAVELRR
jgi:hypothetical protein